ncbi:MAG: uroporphyrinogen-III C-methyltransferase, partial [Lewinella sp.]|nr:uroporphyrinogen-III C-methyltransferase [Lewinella sp.]
MGFHLTSPRISLVGAGPGDPELLTLKGLRIIKSADVILYDALLSKELLDFARLGVPLLYVGKRCGKHAMSQEAINQLLVESALQYGHAVRLKGGDPFVFGRGGEEWAAARSAGIPVTVVPGISSALAVPALAGIPLTHRGLSRGFWVLTATTQVHQLPKEMEEAARSCATVVILMGTRKVAEIATIFSLYRPGDTPMALLQSGSLPESKTTVGTITKAEEIIAVAEGGVRGILVIGEVVDALREESLRDHIDAC